MQRRYAGDLAKKDKNYSITIIAKRNEAADYPYISMCRHIAIDGTTPECYWHIIKVAAYLQMVIHVIITTGESIG